MYGTKESPFFARSAQPGYASVREAFPLQMRVR